GTPYTARSGRVDAPDSLPGVPRHVSIHLISVVVGHPIVDIMFTDPGRKPGDSETRQAASTDPGASPGIPRQDRPPPLTPGASPGIPRQERPPPLTPGATPGIPRQERPPPLTRAQDRGAPGAEPSCRCVGDHLASKPCEREHGIAR